MGGQLADHEVFLFDTADEVQKLQHAVFRLSPGFQVNSEYIRD